MKKICLILFSFILKVSAFSVQPVEDLTNETIPIDIHEITEGKLTKEMKENIHFSLDGPNKIGYLDIKKEYRINQSTYLYVKYALEHYKKIGVSFVIVKIDSLGGEIFQAAKIVDLFQKLDINHQIPLIAYIDEYAIASSVMLALACRFIAVNEHSIIGGGLPHETSLKIEAASVKLRNFLTNEFINLAKFYKRSPILAEAMADPYLTIVDRNGKLVKLYSDDQVISEKERSDILLSKDGEWLTFGAKQLIKYGIADFMVDPSRVDTKGATGKEWSFEKSALSEEPFLGRIPNATIVSYENWRVHFLSFLTHPAVSSILFVITILAFYLQINTPGFNAAGGTGLIALGLLILCSFSIQSVSFIVLVLLGLSISLILIEIFLIPGFGSIGIFGISLCVISLFMLLLPGLEKFSLLDFESFTFAAGSLVSRLVWLVCALIFSFIAILFIKKFFQHKFINLNKRVLRKEQVGDLDFLERFEEETLPKADSIGITHCSLRPIGKVVINDRIYEAITFHHEIIEKRREIIVIKHENGRIVVRENISNPEYYSLFGNNIIQYYFVKTHWTNDKNSFYHFSADRYKIRDLQDASHLSKMSQLSKIKTKFVSYHSSKDKIAPIQDKIDLSDFNVNGQEIPYHLIDILDAGEEYNVFK
ncbi:hypothetical protein COB11_02860, partial [Candidatus Aerophobetes bacterium]